MCVGGAAAGDEQLAQVRLSGFLSRCGLNVNAKAVPRDFPNGKVGEDETPSSSCKGCGFNPWSGN